MNCIYIWKMPMKHFWLSLMVSSNIFYVKRANKPQQLCLLRFRKSEGYIWKSSRLRWHYKLVSHFFSRHHLSNFFEGTLTDKADLKMSTTLFCGRVQDQQQFYFLTNGPHQLQQNGVIRAAPSFGLDDMFRKWLALSPDLTPLDFLWGVIKLHA